MIKKLGIKSLLFLCAAVIMAFAANPAMACECVKCACGACQCG